MGLTALNLRELQAQVDGVASDVQDAIDRLLDAELTLEDKQELWAEAQNRWLKNVEGAGESPPGGGRWNDDKRLAAQIESNRTLYTELRQSMIELKEAEADLKKARVREKNVGYKLRIYELTANLDA